MAFDIKNPAFILGYDNGKQYALSMQASKVQLDLIDCPKGVDIAEYACGWDVGYRDYVVTGDKPVV